MANVEKIDDFGKFIPGSFKHHGAMSYDEFLEMNENEQVMMSKREKVWPTIDAKALVEGGEDAFLVYLKTRMRRMTFAKHGMNQNKNATMQEYVKALAEYRDIVMGFSTENEVRSFMRNIRKDYAHLQACVPVYSVMSMAWNFHSLRERCKELGFPYGKRKKAEKVKQAFKLAPLDGILREGREYRKHIDADEDLWQDTFSFGGVVFGASVPQKERKDDLNYGYDGIMDLACALGIENSDVSFGGKLSISFGARGRGGYPSGHYESAYEVINMTRLRGAGTFAKLWFHALDDALAKFCNVTDHKLASETEDVHLLPKSFVALSEMIMHDDRGNDTCFYIGSKEFDNYFKKNTFGTWNAKAEMMARAFACYLKDCINHKSDYVVAHADSYHWQYENEFICAIPQGDERRLFNRMFENMFQELKEIGFLHNRKEPLPKKEKKSKKKESKNNDVIIDLTSAKQMSIMDFLSTNPDNNRKKAI